MAKEKKIDIFAVMRMLDAGNKNIYANFTDKESLKELDSFIGFLALRWMSVAEGDKNDAAFCLEAINEIANQNYFKLSDHHELQAKLLAIAGARKRIRHGWISPPKKKNSVLATRVVIEMYPHLKDDEVSLWISECGKDAVVDLARRIGWQEDEVKKLEKELGI
jgi:hypothetical protein